MMGVILDLIICNDIFAYEFKLLVHYNLEIVMIVVNRKSSSNTPML